MQPIKKERTIVDREDLPVTLGDMHTLLRAFKRELLIEIKTLVLDQPRPTPMKWLKNKDVMVLLGIKRASLQALRDKGILPFSRIGRQFYYDPQDIETEMERRKTIGRHQPVLKPLKRSNRPH
ncbi:helix-turn-helix domain-containing protein [Puia dinghuensis]|uniref:Helix-turn-helix domain-containing protein n=1 Tax=Puia dinghuensis TaxID=1792502 RepID=A0A8J2ULE8_9BACT|nr:helix-turn-helix domain-containing protein [Puia dinghuensis]GGB26116.1 hypothetical protein GCM10011511_57610 [Puia dinghuensis]